jgi:hypothetical protein
MTLDDLQRIKKWHVAHRHTHPIENQAWDAMLTLWVMGWVGCVPVCALGLAWAVPLCVLAVVAPNLYVAWRLKAHRRRRLRCDWSAAAAA